MKQSLNCITKNIIKYLILFLIGGFLYFNIEILWRGFSHWSMFILGAICFCYSGIQNRGTAMNVPLWKQVLKVDIFVIISEFITGCIVNLWLGWNVWDYSNLPFNILGQSCPQFAILFLPLCLVGIVLDDWICYIFFHETKPHYNWI